MATADKKSKFFRVAVEGGTSDGRVIDRAYLEQMAASYNPVTYGARVNCEHLRGFTPGGPFGAYGDVLALKTDSIDLEIGGKTEKRLALYAQIAPNEQLLAANKLGQKIYTSIEIAPKFGGTDKAYMVGLAITDSPASLGTEVLAFAAANPAISPFAARKQAPDNIFSATVESQIDLDGEANPVNADPTGIFAGLRGLIDSFKAAPPATPPVVPPVTPANDNAELSSKLALAIAALPGTLEAMAKQSSDAITLLRGEFTALTSKLAATEAPDGTKRPLATGGGAFTATDC